MRKILLSISFLLAAIFSFAQFPINTPHGNANTLNYEVGASGANIGFVWRATYADTATANLSFISNVPGIAIRIGDSIWLRNNAATAWINMMRGSGASYSWLLTGNAGTTAGTNFIGTTDYQGIQFKVNNTHAGAIGVGTNIFGDYEGGLVAIGYRAAQNMPLTTKAEVVAIGANTLQDYVGYGNGGHVAVGTGALRNMVNGERNTAVGEYAGFQGTTGDHHAWFGTFAGEVTSGGSFNSGLGGEALRGIKDGSYNTGVGGWGLYRNTTIVDSVTITSGGTGYTSAPTVTFSSPDGASPGTVSTLATGTATINAGAVTGVTITEHGSGYSNEDATVTVTFSGGGGSGAAGTVVLRSATGNTGLGFAAGGGNYSSQYDVHVGYLSGWGTNGLYDSYNTFIGTSSGRSSTLSTTDILTKSTAIGYNAKASTSSTLILGGTGADQVNVGIGTLTPAKYLEVSGSDILVYTHTIGRGGGAVATNTVFGYQGLAANTTGFAKVAIGYQALNADNSTAAGEVGIGYQAMGSMLDPSQSVAIGYRAMYGSGAKIQRQSIAIGTHAMENAAATGGLSSENNIGIGQNSLYNLTTGYNNTMLGWYSGYTFTTQIYNTGIGLGALYGATGNYLTAVGISALQNASGDGSVAMGYAAGFSMAGATGIFIGYRAGYGVTTGTQGIYIGRESGNLVTTGNYNVIIGGNDGSSIATLDNRIIIADGQGNQRLYIDNTGLFNLNGYGSGTHTGTATKYLAINSSGDIIEENVPAGAAPLLPTTGTGTATGSVTGDLDGNDLFVINGNDIDFISTTGRMSFEIQTDGQYYFYKDSLVIKTDTVYIEDASLASASAGYVRTLVDPTTGSSIWAAATGGGGTPGGSNTQVQYNNSGSFGGISGATSDGTNMTFGSGNLRATSPRVTTALLDANGNELFLLTATTSAVNEITYANAATGTNPSFTASGGDANVGFDFTTKAAGNFNLRGNSTQAATLRLFEDTDDGTNYTAFKVGAQAGDITYTLPTADGSSGYVLSTNGSGVLSWIAAGGSVTWNGISNPTGSQTLTFDAGETSTWTNSNTTSTLLTVTSNALTTGSVLSATSSSLTSGKFISLASTSTALATGNAGIDIAFSGANASSSITSKGINISITNTGTGATNYGIYSSATGTATNYGGYFVSNGTGVAGALGVENTNSNGLATLISSFATNLSAGQGTYSFYGKATGSLNAAYMYFQYVGTSNTSNRYTIGFSGGSDVMSIFAGNTVSIGTTTSYAKLGVLSTTEQLRLLYDASNYVSFTVSSSGLLTINNTGSGSALTVTDGIIDTRIRPRTTTTASTASLTIDSDTYDFYAVTALAADMTINAPTGTPTEFQKLTIRILDDGTSRALTWNAAFREIGVTLPASTTINKVIYVYCNWNVAASKWDVTSVAEQA